MAQPVLTASGLGDLVQTTLRDLGRMKFTELTTDLQKHVAMDQLLKKNRRVLGDGYGVQWDVMVQHSGSASNVGLGASDNVAIIDTMVQATADWRNSVSSWAVIGQEISMNAGKSRIVDLIQTRRLASLIALAELMENNFWGPPVALTDSVTPWGVRTWMVKSATEGFNGTVPSGYTTIGLNPTNYPRWCNYTVPYTTVSKDDLIRKWRKAATFTDWKPPVANIPTFQDTDKLGWYTNYSVIGPLEEALESQNDNLGNDVASKDGMAMFRRVGVEWVPKLEGDTTGVIYGIPWGDFKTYVLSGWWLKETSVPVYPGQHTVSAHFVDFTYQWVMKNRRRAVVCSTGTTEPS